MGDSSSPKVITLTDKEADTLWHHLKGVEEAREEFADPELVSIREKLEEA